MHPGGRPRLFNSAEEIESKINQYKQYLKNSKKPPTMAGLAYYLGMDRISLYNYSKKDEYFNTIKKYRDWVAMNWEEYSIDKGHGGIVFMLKNYGYTDKVTNEVITNAEPDPITKSILNSVK
jgi:hypothetical protein